MRTLRTSTSTRPATIAVMLALTGWAGAAIAQEPPTPQQLERLMARSMELAQPGPEHGRLAALVGAWDVQMTVWPQPGADPMIVNGSGEAQMILGGRFLWQRFVIDGGAFAGEAIHILGFDRRAGEYTLIGLDTSGTYWVTAQGPAQGDATAVLSGEDFDAVFGGTQLYDFVLRWPDADTFITEIIFKDAIHTRGGEPFKMVESVARRRQ